MPILGFEVKKRGSHLDVQFAELAIPGFGVKGASVSTRQNPGKAPIGSFLLQDSEGNKIEIVTDKAPAVK